MMVLLVQIVIALIGAMIGLSLYLWPVQVIEIQKKFYENINWRIEPISMSKEIRNTKLMGLFLISCAIFIVIYSVMITAK